MQNKAAVKKLCLFIRKLSVRAQGSEYDLGGTVIGLCLMDIKALMVEILALDLIGVSHDYRNLRYKLNRLP